MKKHTFLILAATILIFGMSWPINKLGLEYMSPVGFATGRLVIATLTMFLITILTKNFIFPTRQDWPLILSIGLLQMGAYVLFINLGLQFVEAGRTSILAYTTLLWVTPIAVLFFKERATFCQWLGVLLGLFGVMVLFAPATFNWHSQENLFGNAILLVAALCWAIAILCARYMPWQHSALQLIPWQFLVGTLPVVVFMLLETPTQTTEWGWPLLSTLLFTGILATALGTWGIIIVSKTLPTLITSLSLLAVPVCGILFSAIILHEPITTINIIAIVLIFAGILLTLFEQKFTRTTKTGEFK